ncbi:hypothetical protein ACELLULO517_15820 [Acidisoma cellulosilytica]|uniref:Gp5/Type VI secretion system Vgr protein OB-fold domain-containing protein n=1 Tax=Acidisoma cellulosilyticum TaxID=2802395 RepID=A0A964E4Q5_9PROT|nr:phage baseplate assembly protein V [Acidisoma cellulosilyticum]MCB8881716.1 hypothetical protein [Acidisoma cellulosilyticum]
MMRALMQRFRALMRRDIEAAVSTIAQPRYATIASVDPDNHAVKLAIQPEGVLSGWVPDGSAVYASGGYGIVAPPQIGDQVLCVHAHGDGDHPVVIARIFSTVDMPPVSGVTNKSVQPGEFGIFSPGGAWAHFVSDGSLHAAAPAGAFIAANTKITGTLTVTGNTVLQQNLEVDGDMDILGTAEGSGGNLVTKGNITDLSGSHGSVQDFRTTYDGHIHPGVQTGDGSTAKTLQTQ